MKLRLPLSPALPAWQPADTLAWATTTKRAATITQRVGQGRDFLALVTEIRRLVESGALARLDEMLEERRAAARALLHVWQHDERLARRSLDGDRVRRLLRHQNPRPTYLTTTGLAAVLLKYFDELDSWSPGLFDEVSTATARAVQSQKTHNAAHDLVATMRSEPRLYLDRQGPDRLGERLVAQNLSLSDHVRRTGLLGFDDGRYGERVRQAFYLTRIRRADHTTSGHEVLTEVAAKSVKNSLSATAGRLFGLDLLVALTDRTSGTPSDEWLQAVIDIGGDPRLRHTADWRTWWEPLPRALVDRVTTWLSAEDLRLFLMAVENFGRQERVSDLQRLFPPRKKFLWGLYDSGLVKETRLILGTNVRNSVVRQVGRLRTDAAKLESMPNTAIIFVDCGDFHIVEGSHHFKMWLYAGRPVPLLTDRSKRRFTGDELRYTVPLAHSDTHPLGYNAHDEVTHNGFWQRRALEFLIEKHGFPVEPRAVLSPEDYSTLKHKFGLPVRRTMRGR
ncbi:EH signature domain-containing protein [Georgenia muralis]